MRTIIQSVPPLSAATRWFRCIFSGLVTVLFLTAALPARAADLIVVSAADAVNGDVSSPGALIADPGPDGISLREAILAANNTPGPHTITFSVSLTGATVALTSPLMVTRDGVTLTGLSIPSGQPAITLDGQGITDPSWSSAVLMAYASDFTMSWLAVTGVKDIGVRIQAGETVYPPAAPPTVRNIRIENNVFDNTGVDTPNPFPAAIRVWTDPEGVAVNATIAGVRIAYNTFRHFSDSGIIVNANGSNCIIHDLVIEANIFTDIPFQVELAFARGANNRIIEARIIRNTFENATVSLLFGAIGSDHGPETSDNVIDDTSVRGNVFSGNMDSLDIIGGFTDGHLTRALRNIVRNTEIANNLIVAGRGIHITGGGAGGEGNSVDGVRIVNNTIVTHPLAGLRVDVNRDGGSGNHVTGVRVQNTIFHKRQPGPTPEEQIDEGYH